MVPSPRTRPMPWLRAVPRVRNLRPGRLPPRIRTPRAPRPLRRQWSRRPIRPRPRQLRLRLQTSPRQHPSPLCSVRTHPPLLVPKCPPLRVPSSRPLHAPVRLGLRPGPRRRRHQDLGPRRLAQRLRLHRCRATSPPPHPRREGKPPLHRSRARRVAGPPRRNAAGPRAARKASPRCRAMTCLPQHRLQQER